MAKGKKYKKKFHIQSVSKQTPLDDQFAICKKSIREHVPEIDDCGSCHIVVGVRLQDQRIHWVFQEDRESNRVILDAGLKEQGVNLNKIIADMKALEIENVRVNRLLANNQNGISMGNQSEVHVVASIQNRKILFHHSRALGDCLMFTAGVRDFSLLFPSIKINVESNFPALWENNPYLDRTIKKGDPGVEYYRVGYPIIGACNNSYMHFASGFLFDMIAMADEHLQLPISLGEFTSTFAKGEVGDPGMHNKEKNPEAREPFISRKNKYRHFCDKFARQYPDLHLTDEEKSKNIITDLYGVEKYWVIAPGGKRDCTCKIWDWRKFQEVIDHFEGKLTFVTIGRSDHLIERLTGVIDLTDKFNDNVRGLIPLIYNAEGCVSGVSFLMHLAAGLYRDVIEQDPSDPTSVSRWRQSKPCVSIYGGREPTTFTWYCNHQVLHTNGAFKCCSAGGCWHSRVSPIQKSADLNRRLCAHPVVTDGKTIQECMDVITPEDVIRGIEKYYDGDIYTYVKGTRKQPVIDIKPIVETVSTRKEIGAINILASMNTRGGGEQSALMIAQIMTNAGWRVNLHPWAEVHEKHTGTSIVFKESFRSGGMLTTMEEGLPLLFYANDQIRDFLHMGEDVVKRSSDLIIGINYVNDQLPTCEWIIKSGKLRGIIFQNREKQEDFKRKAIGFDNVKLVSLFGAIDLNKFLEVCPSERKSSKDQLIVIKHGMPDGRKYVTKSSEQGGHKPHLWQKNIVKEIDTKFYSRLLKDTKNVRFEFMEAHSELVTHFKNEPRMIFHKFDAMPVTTFLARGHVYLERASNHWQHQYPRTVAEALAAGLPVLSEPRDGCKDRMDFGNIGFHCVDYDGYLYALKLLNRKEKYRYSMGMRAKEWAKENLDPKKWVEIIKEILGE